ncbi:RNA-binding ATPase activator esf2 [Paraphaeosphaeria minitans]|uniref:18S rRNA factor 2 n=1 Tax=Paraphaeosphaeria minitans TaxID=565426 RepID=A0A9P6GS79_9PLEO|nr:RNA recognition domain-containing protein [Paraphaeosphaeria minitans]
MATRKRNEWLDADESEEEERDYESEDESRSRMLKPTKRRKIDHESDSDDAADEPDADQEDENEDEDDAHDEPTFDSPTAELAHLEKLAATLPKDLKLSSTQLGATLALSSKPKKDKSGVIYLSRIPPFMKPTVLRSLLTPYGAVGRVFMTPEPAASRTQRLRTGGTRRKLYLDGWVEFLSKKDAKFVAENLNAQTMGGKKRGRWHDEVWNVKYLSGVKWAHLVEQIQNENAERTARLRVEIAKGNKENARFLENVERGKMLGGMEAKRKAKGEEDSVFEKEVGAVGEAEGQQEGKRQKERRSKFSQREMRTKADKKPEPGQDVQRVLGSIF